MTKEALKTILEERKAQGKKVVMCSGTFDLTHVGHIRFLERARQCGDLLIVGVKSDRAASLKKKHSPILRQEDRLEIVQALRCVDYAFMVEYDPERPVPFSYENKSSYEWLNMFYPAVEFFRPDVFAYEDNPVLKEARKTLFVAYGVDGKLLKRTEGISTSEKIEKVRREYKND